MVLYFYLISFLAFILAGIIAFFSNRGITKRKNLKIILVLLGLTIVFFGLGKLLDSGSDNKNIQASTHSNKTHEKVQSFPPVTKDQYNKLKIGMTIAEASKVFGKKPPEEYIVGFNGNENWRLDGENNSSVDLEFEKNKLVEKSEIGLLADGSNTVTDKNGTKNDNSNNTTSTTNDDYANYVQSDIEDAVGSTVDWSLNKKVNTVKKVEVNDNLGKKDGSKLILLYLNAPVTGTNNAIKKLVNEDTLKIAKSITEDNTLLNFKKDSITYFWYLPLTDKYGKTSSSEAYKISLGRDTLQKIDYIHLNDVNLPAIADQYNVLYKE